MAWPQPSNPNPWRKQHPRTHGVSDTHGTSGTLDPALFEQLAQLLVGGPWPAHPRPGQLWHTSICILMPGQRWQTSARAVVLGRCQQWQASSASWPPALGPPSHTCRVGPNPYFLPYLYGIRSIQQDSTGFNMRWPGLATHGSGQPCALTAVAHNPCS